MQGAIIVDDFTQCFNSTNSSRVYIIIPNNTSQMHSFADYQTSQLKRMIPDYQITYEKFETLTIISEAWFDESLKQQT